MAKGHGIALHLFDSVDAFESALKKESVLQSIAGSRLRGLQVNRWWAKGLASSEIETILAVQADVS